MVEQYWTNKYLTVVLWLSWFIMIHWLFMDASSILFFSSQCAKQGRSNKPEPLLQNAAWKVHSVSFRQCFKEDPQNHLALSSLPRYFPLFFLIVGGAICLPSTECHSFFQCLNAPDCSVMELNSIVHIASQWHWCRWIFSSRKSYKVRI